MTFLIRSGHDSLFFLLFIFVVSCFIDKKILFCHKLTQTLTKQMQKAKTYENEIHNKDRIIFYDNYIIPLFTSSVKRCNLLKNKDKIKK